jgi:ATP-binding cassette subfamily F protein 3
MPLLTVHNLKKSFVTRVLFENVSFEVESGDHIGFVGVNGCGKSTLFRILLGEEQADEGTVNIPGGTTIGSMNQNVSAEVCSLFDYVLQVFSELSAIEAETDRINSEIAAAGGDVDPKLIERQHALNEKYWADGGSTYRARTRSTLLGLGFTEDELSRSINSFSGGQRNKAQLAKLLLSDANLLLLDEPTNHLDISAIEWLENFLSAYRGSFIVISHDRYFLDKVTNRTMELKDRRLFISKGNYSRHLELRSTARELEMRQYLRTKKEIKRIEGIVEQQRRWGQERNFITAASKQKQADRLKATLVEPERDSVSIHFHFEAKEVGGNDVLAAKKLAKSFDGKLVFRNVDMLIKKGEKVFLLGDNGCGKTTLLNILAGRIRPTEGSYYLGSHVEEAYYEQTMTSLDPEATVLREVWDRYYTTISHKDICNALAAFLFRGDEIEKQIKLLSGGEAARVQLLKLMLTKANLLLLDEPTNHLDIASREALEAALEGYNGTMLIVTHDRYLVNRLADRILHMTPNGLQEYIGGYDDYIAAVNESRAQADEQKRTQSRNALDYRERKQQQSILNRAKGEAARCEAAVSKAEAELDEINEELAKPHIASDYKKACELSEKAAEKRQQIDELYKKWEAAEERLAELTSADD